LPSPISKEPGTFFQDHFGAVFGEIEDVKDQGYRYVPFSICGFTLELLEPYNPDHPIARFLRKRGEGLYQLSLRIDDLDEACRQLEAGGVKRGRPPQRPGARHLRRLPLARGLRPSPRRLRRPHSPGRAETGGRLG
jgi:methylmalonyl-CoA/ethylmalonyl-CoA epimerase